MSNGNNSEGLAKAAIEAIESLLPLIGEKKEQDRINQLKNRLISALYGLFRRSIKLAHDNTRLGKEPEERRKLQDLIEKHGEVGEHWRKARDAEAQEKWTEVKRHLTMMIDDLREFEEAIREVEEQKQEKLEENEGGN